MDLDGPAANQNARIANRRQRLTSCPFSTDAEEPHLNIKDSVPLIIGNKSSQSKISPSLLVQRYPLRIRVLAA